METAFLLLNLAILGVTLESDLGARRIRWFRVLRPALSAVIAVPFFFKGFDTTAWGLLLEVGALTVGVSLGLAVCSLMRFQIDLTDGQPRTRAGLWYAFGWTAVAALKIGATYAVTAWFPQQTGQFMAMHDLSPDSVRAAFICLALGSPLIRPAYLWIGGTRHAKAHGHSLWLFRRVTRTPVGAKR